ncbi:MULTISPECIES: DUF3012 domain-containing protein [Vibrio]|jgi:hypothetical protein|uniref:DUF3012 domain-containing protein n=1 Tax=Vibrio TaxID=662 RepID=UPI000BFFE7B5|nr:MULTISPECIES: DUF3012 domain-containing protein [unclassified Vibrio]PHJ43056.1 hypothetical protein AK965_03095 [Vibrio sp. PID17_43]RIZ53545.1 hypothetical protein AK966_12640 [Vibrio sp. PID23_8]
MKNLVLLLLASSALTACSDEVGTEGWCNDMSDKAKTEWTTDNALDFAKYCVLQDGIGSEQWCKNLKDKPKGEWTANEATSYTKHCIF